MIMMTGKIDSGAMCSMKVLLVVYLERTSFVEVNVAELTAQLNLNHRLKKIVSKCVRVLWTIKDIRSTYQRL